MRRKFSKSAGASHSPERPPAKRARRLGECDLVDGTPVFDIKPYVPAYDSFPEARAGWIEEVDALMAAPPSFTVQFSPLATAQADWLRANWQIDFSARLHELLARDPTPHRTRCPHPFTARVLSPHLWARRGAERRDACVWRVGGGVSGGGVSGR